MKRNKRRLLIITAAMLLLASSVISCFAASNFIIRDFDIKMVVRSDDTYEITETLNVEFTAPSHGIYVEIPSRTRLDRDGQLSQFNAGVSDFRMLSGQPVSESQEQDVYSFRIGDPDKYADTETTYQYSYVYDTKGDHLKGADEVYHNLVGTTWEAQSIDHVSFEVVFPEAIDAANVGIKTGDGKEVPFEAPDDRTIKGETTENVMGGLTIRAVLPEGYFTREAKSPVALFYIMLGGLAALAAVGLGMWRKYGRDPVYPVTEQFYPPDGLSAPETAYLANGSIRKQDVVSTLLSLADRGYLKIREFEEEYGKKHKKKSSYEIIKLKDYDDDVVGEKAFMDGLFESGDTVNIEDLEDKFYKTIEGIEKEISGKYEGMLYDKTAASKAGIMKTGGWIGLIALTIVSRIAGGTGLMAGSLSDTLFLFLPAILIGIGYSMAAIVLRDKGGLISYLPTVIMVPIGVVLARYRGTFYGWLTIPFIVGLVLCLVLFILSGLCEKKTDWYAEIHARIKGYIDFLKTAEKDQMETLAESDPGYYYKNLAYAFALGVTAVYASRFTSIATKAPEWYESPYYHDHHDAERVTGSLNDMMTNVGTSLTSSPSDSSGGGSFSGGGGGGGSGGGSW